MEDELMIKKAKECKNDIVVTEALKFYKESVSLVSLSIKDGGNVHGAFSQLVAAEDSLKHAIGTHKLRVN